MNHSLDSALDFSQKAKKRSQFGFWIPLMAPRNLEGWRWEGSGQVQRQRSEVECCCMTRRRSEAWTKTVKLTGEELSHGIDRLDVE